MLLIQMQSCPEMDYLKATPGIGDILALTIVLETGDIERFKGLGNPEWHWSVTLSTTRVEANCFTSPTACSSGFAACLSFASIGFATDILAAGLVSYRCRFKR